MERQSELEDVRQALALLRTRQDEQPLNEAQERLYHQLCERERQLAGATGVEMAGVA